MVRIQTGNLKGQTLRTPKGRAIRPTTSYMRERVFNIIGIDRINGARFLDLCSGTGAMAFEAISRGAEYAYLVECDRDYCGYLHDNARKLDVEDKLRVACIKYQQAPRLLVRNPKLDKYFNIVYFDPPYNKVTPLQLINELQGIIVIVANDALIFIESITHAFELTLPITVGNFTCVDERHTGNSQITIWQVSESARTAPKLNMQIDNEEELS